MNLHEQLKDLLINAGLGETEAILYIELLKDSSQTKWELIKRTGFDKNRIYRAFDHLKILKMIKKTDIGIEALSLNVLISDLEKTEKKNRRLSEKLRRFSPFLKIPIEAVDTVKIADNQEDILNMYIMMSEINYDTCLDFGDLENFVPVLGGMDPVFKFRVNRFKQRAKNRAICTTVGPYTSCMARKNDLKAFKSNIEILNIDFNGKWLIFSDTDDRIMFNDFSDPKVPVSVLVKSKVIADTQRTQFDQFYKNLQRFS